MTTGQISPAAAAIFVVLIAITLYITYWAGKRNKSAASHLVASGQISGKQNGVAIAGDFISAATFLGITGAIALGGLNGVNTGFFLAAYIPIAYLLAMLLVAEPLRNLGHFTLGAVSYTHLDVYKRQLPSCSSIARMPCRSGGASPPRRMLPLPRSRPSRSRRRATTSSTRLAG